ncbi:phage antirepressor KilAC domain-containing protein [Anabaena sp. CCY 9402-a]|uniref:phage antirepressor KilAC domain-containing protein n=1 Tax=Anabaena sp. CCY 9402-a TaxID=3103867 RepID=UPI0039C5C0D8
MTSLSQFSQSLAIDIYESQEPFPVSFDDAWQWLGYSRKDSAKRNFDGCGFIEDVDYQLHTSVGSVNHSTFSPQALAAAARKEDIYITAECLKQWGMMSGTEQGKQIRLYFLKCERIAKRSVAQPPAQPQLPTNYIAALEALLLAEKEKIALSSKTEEQALVISQLEPKAQAADVLAGGNGNYSMQEAAQLINVPNMGRTNLFTFLKKNGFLIDTYHAYQKYLDMGVFSIRTYLNEYGRPKTQVLVTPKGIQYLIKKLEEHGYTSAKLQGV